MDCYTFEFYGDLEEDYNEIITIILNDYDTDVVIDTIILSCDGETPHCDVCVIYGK